MPWVPSLTLDGVLELMLQGQNLTALARSRHSVHLNGPVYVYVELRSFKKALGRVLAQLSARGGLLNLEEVCNTTAQKCLVNRCRSERLQKLCVQRSEAIN